MAIPIEAPDGLSAAGLGATFNQLGSSTTHGHIETDIRFVLKMAPMIQRNKLIRARPTVSDHRRPNRSIPKATKMAVATIWKMCQQDVFLHSFSFAAAPIFVCSASSAFKAYEGLMTIKWHIP